MWLIGIGLEKYRKRMKTTEYARKRLKQAEKRCSIRDNPVSEIVTHVLKNEITFSPFFKNFTFKLQLQIIFLRKLGPTLAAALFKFWFSRSSRCYRSYPTIKGMNE